MNTPIKYVNLTIIHNQYCLTVWDKNVIVDSYSTPDIDKIKQQLLNYKSKYRVNKLKNETGIKVTNV